MRVDLQPHSKARTKWGQFYRWHFQVQFFFYENLFVFFIQISLKFVSKISINNGPVQWVQIMTWHPAGDKPVADPCRPSLLMHICITGPQWVNMWCAYCFEETTCFNPLCAKFFRGKKNIYLNFISILYIYMTQVIGILPHERPRLAYFT